MPLLVYTAPGFPFIPFTIIHASDHNALFSDIRTLLNVTKLDDVNIQDDGITAATKLKPIDANEVVITDADGHITSEQYLAYVRGGLGTNLTPGADEYVIQTLGGVFTLQPQVQSVAACLKIQAFLYNS